LTLVNRFFTLAAFLTTEATMPAKKTVYVASTGSTLTERRGDVEKLKQALKRVFTEYRKLKGQERRFELALGELCAITTRWSIPRRELTELRRMMARG
jgi:hypothetical protein